MLENLTKSASRAAFWSFFDRIANRGAQFIISIIIARSLLPSDLALMGMLVIFTAVAQSFVNSGFGQALIQKKDATHLDECSVFYFNIFIAVLMAGILCLAAPWSAGAMLQP